MELSRDDTDRCAVLRVSGSVRPEDAARLRDGLWKAMAEVPTCLMCDLSAVTGLSPVCVAVLVGAQWTAPWPGPAIWLVGAHGQPAEALEATGAARFLGTADSVSAAMARQATSPPRLRERLTLPSTLSSPSRARRFTEELLARWQVANVTDDASLVVSELVTNGVQHAGSDLELRLEHGRDLLHIAVRDHGRPSGRFPDPPRPQLRPAGGMTERGRGLEIVRTVADGAGHTEGAAGGSVYWATLRTGDGRATQPDQVGGVVTEVIVVRTGLDAQGAQDADDDWTAGLRLTWRPDEPDYVALTLSSPPHHPGLPGGRWLVRRDSLARALSAPVIDNAVEMRPVPDQVAVMLDLYIRGRVRSALVPAHRLQGFLDGLGSTDA
jgi:anti-sigma regulatory factor (Ser/Thr protein kinase)